MNHSFLFYLIFLDPLIGLYSDFSNGPVRAFKSSVSYYNAAFAMNVPLAHEVESTKLFFGSTPFFWFSLAEDLSTKTILKSHDFRKITEFSIMSKALNVPITFKPFPEVRIESVNTIDQLDDFIKVGSDIFKVSFDNAKIFISKIRNRTDAEYLSLYVAYYENVPVSILMLTKHPDKIASIHFVGTIASQRKKKITSVLINKALFDAQESDCEKAILQSSKTRKSFYEKFGFKVDTIYDTYMFCN